MSKASPIQSAIFLPTDASIEARDECWCVNVFATDISIAVASVTADARISF